jgi:hypothetical protein
MLQQGGLVAVAPTNNTLAVVSLVAGIGSFLGHLIPFVGGFTLALVAIITGHMARSQIRKTGEAGMGLATAGLVVGYVHMGLIAVVIVFFFGFVIAVFTAIFSAAATGG